MIAPKERTFSVGIVGAGEMVARHHLPALQAIDRHSVRWVIDVDDARARSVSRAYEVPVVPRAKDLSEMPPCDTVLLAIPYGARKPYLDSLLKLGWSVYLEKPLARTTAEHRELCSAFVPHRLGCGYQRRSWGAVRLLRDLVEDELLGPLREVRLGFGGPGVKLWGSYAADVRMAGGGVLFEFAVHFVDAMIFCAGATNVEVSKVRMVSEAGYDLHTEASLSLVLRSGSTVPASMVISRLADTSESLEFDFEHGRARVDFLNDTLGVENQRRDRRYRLLRPDDSLYPVTSRQTLFEHWTAFFDGLRTSRPNYTSASEAVLTTELLERLYDKGHRRGA
jgi:predicted dehydrogenase